MKWQSFTGVGILNFLLAGHWSDGVSLTETQCLFLPSISKGLPVNSLTFPEVDSRTLGSCSPETHDKYFAIGPDGNKYRTWHPIYDAEADCCFAPEHGNPPHPDAPPIPYGYVSYLAGSYGMIAAHSGYKTFSHYTDGNSGFGAPGGN